MKPEPMKKPVLVVVLFALYVAPALIACSAVKQAARTVLDVAQIACLLTHEALDDNAAMLACHIVTEHGDEAKRLLAAQRKASMARASAPRCASDAGSDAGELRIQVLSKDADSDAWKAR